MVFISTRTTDNKVKIKCRPIQLMYLTNCKAFLYTYVERNLTAFNNYLYYLLDILDRCQYQN